MRAVEWTTGVQVMVDGATNGERKEIGGRECVWYDGYWIRWYQPPAESLSARKDLIVQLTRRAFHHTEAGINTPGDKLEEARAAYEREDDPALKRVNAAMLAGALFNRATDIFTTVVDLAEKGVEISPSNGLLRQCGSCFKEALQLGKRVRHYSGHEGIDELWGEPLKAFTMPIADFYESRYIKIAQTMRDIDRICSKLAEVFRGDEGFAALEPLLVDLAEAAKREAETMKSDPVIFEVWPKFVVAHERVKGFRPRRAGRRRAEVERSDADAISLIHAGAAVVTYIAGARVPMPKSSQAFMNRCAARRAAHRPRLLHVS